MTQGAPAINSFKNGRSTADDAGSGGRPSLNYGAFQYDFLNQKKDINLKTVFQLKAIFSFKIFIRIGCLYVYPDNCSC